MKKIISGTEKIHIGSDVNQYCMARIDTGAKSCSLNALDIKVSKPEIDEEISFVTANEKGTSQNVCAKIHSIDRVKSQNGSSQRYSVLMELSLKDVTKTVKVTLADRSKMKCPLLIGRNLLNNDFLVDVSKNNL